MKISIIGTNGMISEALTQSFFDAGDQVDVYGLNMPNNYPYTNFSKIDLLNHSFDFDKLILSDIIIYAAGAGVQAALNTDASLMYKLNVNVPIELTIKLKKNKFKGIYISFGSYMEIGLNDNINKAFTEIDLICSQLPVSNDYALSKRLYSRYMIDFVSDFRFWHFVLPNMFSYNDLKPGTRLIPYVLDYLNRFNSGEVVKEPSFSTGLQLRQYIMLEEIKLVIDKAVEFNMSSGVYNIGGGEFMSVRALIERLFQLYNVPCKSSMFGQNIRRDGDIMSLKINGDKLYKAIHYLPNIKIDEIFRTNL